MTKNNIYKVVRNHQDGKQLFVTETTDFSHAELIFDCECSHFRELTLNTQLTKYMVTSIVLLVNGKKLEEHIRHYGVESDGD